MLGNNSSETRQKRKGWDSIFYRLGPRYTHTRAPTETLRYINTAKRVFALVVKVSLIRFYAYKHTRSNKIVDRRLASR